MEDRRRLVSDQKPIRQQRPLATLCHARAAQTGPDVRRAGEGVCLRGSIGHWPKSRVLLHSGSDELWAKAGHLGMDALLKFKRWRGGESAIGRPIRQSPRPDRQSSVQCRQQGRSIYDRRKATSEHSSDIRPLHGFQEKPMTACSS